MDESQIELLGRRITSVRQALAEASGGRYPVPKLIAVTKTHPADMILPLTRFGVTDIGENRVQEIVEKLPAVGASFRIHCIGRLQTNKVKYIIRDACMIQSLDRAALADEIDRQAQKNGTVMPVLVQVSPANEPQKGGIAREELFPFLRLLARKPGLSVRGLMAVMPHTEDRAWLDSLFADMRVLFEQTQNEAIDGIRMEELSMGMSGDYEMAAAHGATMVRVGSAIFGPRDYGTARSTEGEHGVLQGEI